MTHPQTVGRGTCTEKIRLKSAWCNRCERVREQRGKCCLEDEGREGGQGGGRKVMVPSLA